jgi:hypothetical protein
MPPTYPRSVRRITLVGLIVSSVVQTAAAQYPYSPWVPQPQFNYAAFPPIRHAVPFHRQQTMVWCWVAAAKMVAEFYGRQPVPDQCEMLQMQYRAPCCQNPAVCTQPGHISQVQGLIAHFGCRFSGVTRPGDGPALYNALQRGPIVLHTRQGAGHFVVATGMRLTPTPAGPLGIVLIHDPLAGPDREINLPTLWQMWDAALVVY